MGDNESNLPNWLTKLFSLVQLWAVCALMAVLPLWFINGLLFPSLSWGWLLFVCAVVGAAITMLVWFLTEREF